MISNININIPDRSHLIQFLLQDDSQESQKNNNLEEFINFNDSNKKELSPKDKMDLLNIIDKNIKQAYKENQDNLQTEVESLNINNYICDKCWAKSQNNIKKYIQICQGTQCNKYNLLKNKDKLEKYTQLKKEMHKLNIEQNIINNLQEKYLKRIKKRNIRNR